LEQLGPVGLEVAESRPEIEEALEDFLRLEASGWKGRGGTAITSDRAVEGFYRRVVRWATDRGSMRITRLRAGGHIVAAELALEEDGRHLGLKAAYDERHRGAGPGQLMVHELLARAFSQRLDSFEFLGNQDEWKTRWATSRRSLVKVQAFAPTISGTAQLAAYRFGRPAVKRALTAVRDGPTRTRSR
jgi:CelD/BcsL family acetyltransferase involved in cellulose biosynthesis